MSDIKSSASFSLFPILATLFSVALLIGSAACSDDTPSGSTGDDDILTLVETGDLCLEDADCDSSICVEIPGSDDLACSLCDPADGCTVEGETCEWDSELEYWTCVAPIFPDLTEVCTESA
ncbi:hypothetical protein KAI87_11900, partial [Myxococcota bacterium]|nr:hypothetical protein [Myxococcota bacterium]